MSFLQGLQGRWDNNDNSIILSWDVSQMSFNEGIIHVIDLKSKGSNREYTRNIYSDNAMRYGTHRISTQRLCNGIEFVEYYVFMSGILAKTKDDALKKMLDQNPEGRLTVAIGHAKIAYSISKKQVDSFQFVSFSMKADQRIPRGIVGYRYQFDNKTEIVELPMDIPASKIQTPAILVPSGSEVELISLKEQFLGNLDISKRPFIF